MRLTFTPRRCTRSRVATSAGLAATRTATSPRRWLRTALQPLHAWTDRPRRARLGGRRAIVCGDPRVLGAVCDELRRQGWRIAWLFDELAVRPWLQRRLGGVRQIVAAGARLGPLVLPEFGRLRISFRGLELGPVAAHWLAERFQVVGRHFGAWQAAWREHLALEQPDVLIVDEDATPLKRLGVVAARSAGVPSLVVQHGLPCIRFGFAPLLADRFCAWRQPAAERLAAWGVEREQVIVTGPTARPTPRWRGPGRGGALRVALLATTPPRDERPDSLAFHLTHATHAEMLRVVFRAVAQLPRVELGVLLHPRTRDIAPFQAALAEFPEVPARLMRQGGDRWLATACCVVSCASSAGVEAARGGAPVVQLLPTGSADLAPAASWGLLATVRTVDELLPWLRRAIDAGLAAEAARAAVPFVPRAEAARRVAQAASELAARRAHGAGATSGSELAHIDSRHEARTPACPAS
jgi:hypothetical protein